MRTCTLIVPTIREDCVKRFFEEWSKTPLLEEVSHVVVMEDNPKRTFKIPDHKVNHLAWDKIEEELGQESWIVPRRSDTVRSFAYWWAWNYTDSDFFITLDDDCYPVPSPSPCDLYGGHLSALNRERVRWTSTLDGNVVPRGMPYFNVGEAPGVVLNHGLWLNVLDLDASTQLVMSRCEEESEPLLPASSTVIGRGTYFPMCGMNVAWRREWTVCMYHMLMGQSVLFGEPAKLPFDRFGDIWCGVVMKRIADECGFVVTSGPPHVWHDRASDPFKNLRKEAPGVEVNEHFWEHVDAVEFSRGPRDVVQLYAEMGRHVKGFVSDYPRYDEYGGYFETLGEAMIEWAGLFKSGE